MRFLLRLASIYSKIRVVSKKMTPVGPLLEFLESLGFRDPNTLPSSNLISHACLGRPYSMVVVSSLSRVCTESLAISPLLHHYSGSHATMPASLGGPPFSLSPPHGLPCILLRAVAATLDLRRQPATCRASPLGAWSPLRFSRYVPRGSSGSGHTRGVPRAHVHYGPGSGSGSSAPP